MLLHVLAEGLEVRTAVQKVMGWSHILTNI